MEGAPHTAKRSMINCCVHGVPPCPVYKGARGEAAGLWRRRTKGGVLLPVRVGLLLARPLPGRTSSPLLLYIRGQGGTPEKKQLILEIS